MPTTEKISTLLGKYPLAAHVFVSSEPKKNGGTRTIAKPNKELKKWLRNMNKLLNEQFSSWPGCMHGGIKKRSYVTYARPHVGKKCVVTVDIKACFDSITQKEVYEALAHHLDLPDDICKQLAARICFRGRVAQGFPTSSFVCNLYLMDTLVKLDSSFRRRHLAFGNYVDDIVVSGTIKDPGAVVNEIATELSRARLKMHKAKVVIMPSHVRQTVCGLLVNKRLSITRQLKARLLREVHRGQINEASLAGWLLNLKNVDRAFARKLGSLASKRNYP